MRKHDVRKWLHAILDLLPVLVIPLFMIYSSNKNYTSTLAIDVPQYQEIDFNQLYNGSTNQSYSDERYSASYDATTHIFNIDVYQLETTLSTGLLNTRVYDIDDTHKYIPRVVGDTAYLTTYDGVSAMGINRVITPSSNQVSLTLYIVPTSSPYTGNFSYCLFDLTQMFGIGNEPTYNEFVDLFPNAYYDYTLSHKQIINVGSQTFNDSDVGSQMFYTLYNSVDKYFNMGNVFNMNSVYDWFVVNIFHGNVAPAIYVVWQVVLYEFVMDLLFLLYGLFMWFIDMVEHIMNKPFKSIK